jgi:hypothetical protein
MKLPTAGQTPAFMENGVEQMIQQNLSFTLLAFGAGFVKEISLLYSPSIGNVR